MKRFRYIIIFTLIFLVGVFSRADGDIGGGGIDITRAQVRSVDGRERERFSSRERISLIVEIYNHYEIDSNIDYKFEISGPDRSVLFTHTGNSSPGNVGRGGSTLRNVPLNFYTGPGEYSFRAYVSVEGIEEARSRRVVFSIFSPSVSILYPPDGSEDLIDRPLVFRWDSSGAVQYRIEVSESSGFHRPIWSKETHETSAAYPVDPPDLGQRLRSGEIYYWRVIGLDERGSRIALSDIAGFSVKAAAETEFSRDLAVRDIVFNSMLSVFPEDVRVDVIVANTGSQAETDIDVYLYIDARPVGSYTIPFIASGGRETATFELGQFLRESARMTASIDIVDDDPRNNILTKNVSIPLPEDYRGVPKIIGRVVDSRTYQHLGGVRVEYTGPRTGRVTTARNGQFIIENLQPGSYELSFIYPGYESPAPVNVAVDHPRAYPMEDIELEKIIPEYTLKEAWDIIIREMPEEIIRELDSYDLSNITVEPEENINLLIEKIREGRIGVRVIGVESR